VVIVVVAAEEVSRRSIHLIPVVVIVEVKLRVVGVVEEVVKYPAY
jgi:hypothetical protein